jgi:hypothetical protein
MKLGALALVGVIYAEKSTPQTGTDTAVRAPSLRLIPGGFAF